MSELYPPFPSDGTVWEKGRWAFQNATMWLIIHIAVLIIKLNEYVPPFPDPEDRRGGGS